MTSSNPLRPKVQKGALVVLDAGGMVGVVPRVLPFQYNPDHLSRSFEIGGAEEEEGQSVVRPEPPEESFSLTLIFDATDAMEAPEDNQPDVKLDVPVPATASVAVQLAALEQLLYPSGSTMLDSGLVEVPDFREGLSALGVDLPLPRMTAPVVLFVWGPHYVLPVSLTSYSVEEQQFSPDLYPIRAEVTVNLDVVKPQVYGSSPTVTEKLAVAAYTYTMGQREALSLGAFGGQFESILQRIS